MTNCLVLEAPKILRDLRSGMIRVVLFRPDSLHKDAYNTDLSEFETRRGENKMVDWWLNCQLALITGGSRPEAG